MGISTRILVVEDDQAHMELIRRAFEAAGGSFELDMARSLGEARASLARSRPQLIIADLRLPDGPGTDLLRTDHEKPPFGMIVMTGFGSERVAADAIKAGALEYVAKSPAALQALPHVAERALREWGHIVERCQAVEALNASRARFEGIVNSAMDAIITADEDGRIVIFNPAAERMFGCPAAEAIGDDIHRFIPERYHSAHRKHLEHFRRTGVTKRPLGEIVALRADGHEFPAEASISQVQEGPRRLATIMLRDLSQRRQAEEERLRLESQLGQAQKMESVGLLAGGIAHDFNNLLVPIIGNAELLLIRTTAGPEQELLREIQMAGERAAELTRRLLAFGRKQVLDLRAVDLGEAVTRFEPMLRRTIREDIQIDVSIAPDLGKVRADVTQIEQVLLNLVLNARDAMPRGGALTIAVQNATLAQDYTSQHPEVGPGHYIMLTVSDTGTGMAPHTQKRLFEPFFTTKGPGKGTGLGLPMVYGIVKQHGGSVSVHSALGSGSTFTIYLPHLPPEAVTVPAPRIVSQGELLGQGGQTIMVVEDNDLVRSSVCEMLRTLGYRVLAADSAEGCYRLAEGHSGTIDLLFTDVILARSNGKEVFTRLSAERRGLKVLFMSGYTSDVIVHHGILDEGVHFIQKPLSLQSLSAKLLEALDV